jgi:vitamin B12 transporter
VFGIALSIVAQAQIDNTSTQSLLRDTVIHLDEVVITQSRLQTYAVGHFYIRVDSLTTRLASVGNAAEMMRKFGYGHIRSYGVGGISTPAFRGSGASHTSILWNGINLISPLNGQSDLSLLPINFVDDVQLQSGGSATLYGSGAIGGTIQFNNKPRFRQGFNAVVTENAGSFSTFFHGLSLDWSKQRWISSTKIFLTDAKNDFKFVNRNFAPAREEVRQHNAYQQYGVLQQNYFQLTPHDLLSLRFWYQDNNTEVPNPSSVSAISRATQNDNFFRSMIGFNHDYNKGHVFIQSSHVHHLLDYRDPLIDLASRSTFDTFINTIENTSDLSDVLELTSGINYTFESATGEELLGGGHRRNRIALYAALKHQSTKWKHVLSARQEFVNGKATPFSPSVGMDYRVTKLFSLFGNISRNYRIPTFNDLYWNGAGARGNNELKPEISWSEELGLKLHSTASGTKLNGQLALFSSQVDNWILWAPTAAVWSPENVKKVWARGVETNGTVSKIFGSFTTAFTGRYSYTLSTSEAVYDPKKEDEIGNQLFFTPKHEAGVTLRVSRKSLHFAVTNNYTGKQYTDDSNNEYLAMKGYNITNLWLSKDLALKKLSGNAMFEINNILNRQVEARTGYPLPGINFKAGVTIRFNKPI